MEKYIIDDVWMALKLSLKNFFNWMIVLWIGLFVFGLVFNEINISNNIINYMFYVSLVMTIIIFIQSIFIYYANKRYVINLTNGLITFPRSDIENSLLSILLLYPYWNLMRTKTIHSSEIENLYLDTKKLNNSKNHIKYTINITGKFGSANLQFLDRQKRDEVRNAIQQSVKKFTNRNIDRKISELI